MSERKVLNVSPPSLLFASSSEGFSLTSQKYYPPDFDPSKLKRRKGLNKDKQMVIRLMAPFSMRCNRCAEYICESCSSLLTLGLWLTFQTRARSSTPEKRRPWMKNTLESRSSGFTS